MLLTAAPVSVDVLVLGEPKLMVSTFTSPLACLV